MAEPARGLAGAGLVLLALGLSLAGVWLTTTPRVRATGWRGAPLEPVATPPPTGARVLPGLLRQVFRGTGFDRLVYTGSDPVVRIQRLGAYINSRKVEGFVVAPEIAVNGPEAGLPPVGPFSVRWTGALEVLVGGTYGFAATSDDGAVLRLGGAPVISDWGPHQMNRRETRVHLEPGWYPVELEYQQDGGDSYLDLEWRQPGLKWQALDGKALRHVRAVAGQPDLGPVPPLAPAPAEEDTAFGVDVVYRPMTALAANLDLPATPAVPPEGPLDLTSTPDRIVVSRGMMPLDALALAPETDPRWDVFSAAWEGLLVVQAGGRHRFRVSVDDGARLQVDDRVVIDAWKYQDRVLVEGEADLRPGLHPFRLSYFNGMGNGSLKPEWQPPGQPWAALDPARLRRPRHDAGWPATGAPLWTAGWPDLELKRDTDLVAPFVHRWNELRDGFPRHRPRPLLRLDADLVVSQAGFHTFWLRSAGIARMHVGAERLEISGHRGPVALVAYLNEGQQPLTLEYLGPGGGEQLALEWSGPSFERRPVRARDLARCGGATGGLALALVLAGLALLAIDGARTAAAVAWIGPRAALGLIFVVALCVRLDNYQRLPSTGDTDDEITPHLSGFWSAHGLAPASWDCVRVYRERFVVEVFGRVFPVVLPFLEYPPLFDSAVGHAMRVLSPHGPFDLPLHLTRLLPIFLSCWCVVLIYQLARELELGAAVALAAAALHALCPLAVLGARLLKADALMAALALIAVLNTVRYRRTGRAGPLALALAAIPLGVLTKPTGLALGPAVLFPLLAARRPWAALAALGATFAGAAAWLAWGWYWDGPRFLELVHELTQVHHRTNLAAFLPLVSSSRITGVEWGAEWWIGLMLLGLGGLMSSRRAAPALSLALFYMVAVAATYDAGHNFGWYRLPLYPPLALGLAVFLGDLARRADPARAFLAAGLLLLPALNLLVPEPYASSRPLLQAVLLSAAALPSLALLVRRMRTSLAAATPVAILVVLLAAYAAADLRLIELYPPIGSVPDPCPNTPLPD